MGRRYGQHFLFRKSILDKIAAAACGERVPLVVEIGPGKGPLTESLLERADRVIAIEVDPYLVHYLQQKFSEQINSARLKIIEGDVLSTDFSSWPNAVIAGNLPYYITSPILQKVFVLGENWSRAVFLVQAEVAERLAASPGSRDYGYLSAETQVYSKPEILFPVSRDAFRPPPKVDSAVVRLTRLNPPAVSDPAGFLRFASVCFRQKRKTLRNNLAASYPKERVDTLDQGRMRAEQLSIGELAKIWERLRD